MDPSSAPGPFLGRSESVAQVLKLIEKAAGADVPVLLTGETGTGKSHLARLLHARSGRARGPFVSVNCAGIPEGLFESEFFGHRRGAFTGAVESRPGLFEEAAGGTLFLDEVGELPISQQAKLLTVIEERSVRAVGGTRARRVDARIVTATSRDLAAEVGAGAFRADLYHRIALLRCELPPLRTRPADVRLIASHLLRELARKYHRPGLTPDEPAWALLLSHPWPGNVRELAHVLEAAVILSGERTLTPEHLGPALAAAAVGPPASTSPLPAAAAPLAEAPTGASPPAAPLLADPRPADPPIGAGRAGTAPPPTSPDAAVAPSPEGGEQPSSRIPRARGGRYSFFGSAEEEREVIRQTLVRCRGNRTRTARELGMTRNTLRDKVRKHRL